MTTLRQPRLLIVDDQSDVIEALRILLKGAGIASCSAASPAAALAVVESEEVDVALVDMNFTRDTTSGDEGLALIEGLLAIEPGLPIIVMTAWGSVDGGVDAMRRGARDYLEKPWQNARLLATVNTQLELGRALRESQKLRAERVHRISHGLPPFIATSRAMQDVVALIDRVAPSDANVLVTGEHGTGKEVVARSIHARSLRSDGPFIPVHAGALSDGVFESELFGHVQGAFTDAKFDKPGCFRLADGGTLFLDEIGTMPLGQQAKILRVLQSGELTPVGSSRLCRVDARVVAATNLDIGEAVDAGRFREDLLYRLNTIEIRLPPLRERREDIAALARQFLGEGEIAPNAMEALLEHSWPGNVRELQHAMERARLLAGSGAIQADHLGLRRRASQAARLDEMTLAEAEIYVIRRALHKHEGNVVAAAKALGLSRSALYRRLMQHGIKVSTP